VPLDQLVDVPKVPVLGEPVPDTSEARRLAGVRLAERVVRLGELLLVLLDGDLDRPQPPHPRERTAERGELCGRVGPEVAQAAPDRCARERVPLEVLGERLALPPVARSLRPGDALPHDRLALAPFHAASVPAVTQVEGQVRNEELDAEQLARRRLALAQIRQYPDPVLRMEARPVEEFDDDLLRLTARMKELMKDANGVGLAATQVGVLRRVFVFAPNEDGVDVLVNPTLVTKGDGVATDDEGCLSLQGITVPVERPCAVRLEGQDETGANVSYELEGMAARIAQHEYDHLDGVLILDRTTPEARREAMGSLRPRVVIR
jgi:peptide deformylase